MRGTTVKSSEAVAEAQEMRERGLTYREIGEHFGVSLKTAFDWCNDPDLERSRERKEGYRGECVECGGPTTGCNGPDKAPKVCVECLYWTPEEIVASMQAFFERHGHSPGERESGEAYEMPSNTPVYRIFGSWTAAVEAAGLPVGQDKRPETTDAIFAAIRSGERTAEIAARYGVTQKAISNRVITHGSTITELRRESNGAAPLTRKQGSAE